ncbi:MAG: hypothetical protein EAX95_08185 [Candidatus Thorarchaeota archaeon]|nr:hypothetical protein [Candidatus Thorarchaeota archaeon]
MSGIAWPKVCARCGSTREEDLIGEGVSVVRQKTKKVGIMGHNYRTYDVALHAQIFLCKECEPIAAKEMEELLPRRKRVSTVLAIIAVVLSLLPLLYMQILLIFIPDFLQAFIAGILIVSILLTFFSSTRISSNQFETSGPRRFFFDWTADGPVRFTNEILLTAFKAANPSVHAKKVRRVSRSWVEAPDSTDCLVGCCFGAILVFAGLWLWTTFVGTPLV